jgi:hypothetical protein
LCNLTCLEQAAEREGANGGRRKKEKERKKKGNVKGRKAGMGKKEKCSGKARSS